MLFKLAKMANKPELDKIIKTYKALTQIPTLVEANICTPSIVNTTWSQRNLEKGKTTKFTKSIIIDKNLKNVGEVAPLDVSNELLSKVSPSTKYRAVLRDNDSKQFLEIWQSHNQIRTVDLSALDIHGSVYTDGELGSFEWSPFEERLLYIAEKKAPKTEPFYKRKPETKNSGDAPAPIKGEEYVFEQDWGEQLVGKKKSVIAQYYIEDDKVEIVDGIPDNVCVGKVKFSLDGEYIIGVAYDTEPRKLGLIYCSNRKSSIFKFHFSSSESYRTLTDINEYSVKSPRFTPDGQQVVWLQRKPGGPHAGGMSLMKADASFEQPKVVVDLVGTETKIKGDKTFYGLYNVDFPKRCWASDNRLLVNTNQKYTVKSYVVNIENGDIIELEYSEGSQIVVDLVDDVALAVRRNFLKPDQLVIGKLPPVYSQLPMVWHELTTSRVVPGLEGCTYKYLDLTQKRDNADSVCDFNAIYLGPQFEEEKNTPLIVWPHGGPHGAFANYFILEAAMFLSLNYAILLVNYRGSLGCGENSVNFLPGKVGTADVADCILATDTALENFPWLNPNAVALCGGSHGGFLVAHLSGQYPEKFKAVVARNPVIDVASMSVISDIPDWCYIEGGALEYTQKGEIDKGILEKMRNASPIVHAHKVKAPTLLQIGSKDLRVPPHQGTEWYHRLAANGVITKMNLYDDNHPLGTVPNEMDNIINTILWFNQYVHKV